MAAIATAAGAHTIDGIVKDQKTGEPLIGSVVEVKELPGVKTTTGLDGSFRLHELPDRGRYTLVVRYLAYKTREVPVEVSDTSSVTITLDEDVRRFGEAVVTGHRNSRTDISAISLEKNAGNVLNVMSQQSIQLSPDVNVAAVLQRVSGVTLEQSASGEASYAILRGMDKRYNYTLVNGVKIPSPDDKNRYIPLNIFPSDLMDRIVVSKSLTADMEGDAAGGVVDMVMKDAPSRFELQANGAVGMSDYFWNGNRHYLSTDRGHATVKAPYEAFGSQYAATAADFKHGPAQVKSQSVPAPNFVGGLSVGNRFFNDHLGVMLAGSVQNTYRGTERTYNAVKMASGEQAMYISSLKHRYYSMHDLTTGVHGKLDFAIGGQKLEWYNMYVRTNSDATRYNNSVSTEYLSSHRTHRTTSCAPLHRRRASLPHTSRARTTFFPTSPSTGPASFRVPRRRTPTAPTSR